MSYGEWSAEWWQWQLSLPATGHPVLSTDGANCADGQEGKVWFLTGTFVTEEPDTVLTVVRESCTVPTGKAIFFPILNVVCSTVEVEPFMLIEEGPDANVDYCTAKFFDGTILVVEDLFVEIDGKALKNLQNYRFQSPVFDFYFENPDDNILGVDCDNPSVNCNEARSVSDGYWIMLPPLSRGDHTIRFAGSFIDPDTDTVFYGLDVTYQLKVVGGKR
jgi:hypothetical protein